MESKVRADDVAVVINGRSVRLAAATLAEVVAAEGLGDGKVATALNGAFVPAAKRDSTPVRDGDRIEIVSPRQGG